MNIKRVTSKRGDDFYVSVHDLGTLKEVKAAIITHLPGVNDLKIRAGPDEKLVTAENDGELLALPSSPLVIEYALSGGGSAVPDVAVMSFLDLHPELQWGSLPAPLRVHLCGQEVAAEIPPLPCGRSSSEGDEGDEGGRGGGGGAAFLSSCLGIDLRWPCCYQTLDFSQSPQLQCFCCSFLPCRFVTTLPVSHTLMHEHFHCCCCAAVFHHL